ncbi:MAG: NADH-ubiquinone oxidoreductase subunit NDUFA12 family protein [Rickettsiales bacterium]
MNKFSTWFYTMLHGKFVGKDEFGNKYYQSKSSTREFGRNHRWVYYKGIPEPSKVPSQWFNWLHYQSDDVPASNSKKYFWEKAQKPNLTGTAYAYYPQGHILGGGKRAKATGDYESWNPNR